MIRGPRLLALLVVAACASGGRTSSSATFQRDIGIASEPDAIAIAERIIQRYQYEVIRTDPVPNLRYETDWKKRVPFGDEHALGITEAENRLIITGRLRNTTDLGANYDLNLTVENRVRVAGSLDWNEGTASPLFRRYADEITEEFRKELQVIGVRRYDTPAGS